MSYLRHKSPQAEGGAALVVAMLVFALVAALMVGLQRDFTLTLQRGNASAVFRASVGLSDGCRGAGGDGTAGG